MRGKVGAFDRILAGTASLVLVGLLGLGCPLEHELELPPVKTATRVRLECQPPKPTPGPELLIPLGLGSSCGVPLIECEERRAVVMQLNARGEVTAAHVRGISSPEMDQCILNDVRALGWRFEPARECSGDPLAGEYVAEYWMDCPPDVGP